MSWRLRFSVAESAAMIAEHVEQESTDEKIISFYETLLKDNEPEVRSEAIGKIPVLAKFCSSSVLIEKILPIINDNIQKD